MYCEGCSEPVEAQSVVRKHNRALRKIVSHLRHSVRSIRAQADSLFMELCDTDTAAELAMRELWESGLFNCGPQDYDKVVKQTIETMKLVKMRFEQTAQAHIQGAEKCQIPAMVQADGWTCTREAGHTGPCAAIPNH